MSDSIKTRDELIKEIKDLRARVAGINKKLQAEITERTQLQEKV
jgi:hypothetical protein